MNRKGCFSIIEYRPRPAFPAEGRIPIGVLIEASNPKLRVVGAYYRAFLNPVELEQLDVMGRELLAHPHALIIKEIEAVLSLAVQPGDVLIRLAEQAIWSFHVTPPQAFDLTVWKGLSFDRVVQEAARQLYAEHVMGLRPAAVSAHKRQKSPPPLFRRQRIVSWMSWVGDWSPRS